MLPVSLAGTNYRSLFVSMSGDYELVRSEDGIGLYKHVTVTD
jgi:hypothetical protein